MPLAKQKLRTDYERVAMSSIFTGCLVLAVAANELSKTTHPIRASVMGLPFKQVIEAVLVMNLVLLVNVILKLRKSIAYYKLQRLLEDKTDGATQDFECRLPNGALFLRPPRGYFRSYLLEETSASGKIVGMLIISSNKPYIAVETDVPLPGKRRYNTTLKRPSEFRMVYESIVEALETSTA
ncbi:MAG: hypothetical protein ACOH18_01755 [Candidatus Saccharimonadaceae bacterium]